MKKKQTQNEEQENKIRKKKQRRHTYTNTRICQCKTASGISFSTAAQHNIDVLINKEFSQRALDHLSTWYIYMRHQ